MSDRQYDALVFIGRFSPLHKGHEAVIAQAAEMADKVIILVGSAFHARDTRNPWTYKERELMIKHRFATNMGYSYHEGQWGMAKPIPNPPSRIVVKPLPDYPYDDNKWKASVRTAVSTSLPWSDFPPKVGLIGHNKDHTSYYLKMFPDWDNVDVDNFKGLNATDAREAFFNKTPYDWSNISPSTYDIMHQSLPEGHEMFKEWNMVAQYKKQWEAAPYPPTFHTVDAVLVQSGHILLVKRKASPGMGLWALPGGFLDVTETREKGAVRELYEETKIKLPRKMLEKMAETVPRKTFDDPNRSTRGRTITTAFFFDLGDDDKLPKVTGADDAEKAVWVPFDKVDPQHMFEDHFHIIDYFTNIG